jgi:hypothetical protein
VISKCNRRKIEKYLFIRKLTKGFSLFATRCTSTKKFPHWFHNWEAWHCDMHRLKDDELAELLIRSGANLNSTDFYGHTPLWYTVYYAIGQPNYRLACYLWFFFSICTSFCRVATKGQRPLLVAKLLAAGSRVGSVDDYPWSQCPLYLAVN